MISLSNEYIQGPFTELMQPLFVASTTKEPIHISIIPAISSFVDMLNKAAGLSITYDTGFDFSFPIRQPDINNDVLVGFSGGKDSVAIAIKLKNQGLNPILYHVHGINRSYPNEIKYCEMIADRLDMELVVQDIKMTGKCDFVESYIKNQYIWALMADYGLTHNITAHAFASALTTSLTRPDGHIMNIEDVPCVFFTDLVEVYIHLNNVFKTIVPNLRIKNCIRGSAESDSILLQHDPYLFNILGSCVTPDRYRGHLHKHNMKKYGIVLPECNCGSCYKCCTITLSLHSFGAYTYPDDYIKHCIEIIDRVYDQYYPFVTSKLDEKIVKETREWVISNNVKYNPSKW